MKMILFPSDYFDINKIDGSFKNEYEVVCGDGNFEILLFSYDEWIAERKLKLNYRVDTMKDTIYRGWMMKPEIYKNFYCELQKKNIQLMTAPNEYAKFHSFPNIYPELQEDTAKMLVYGDINKIDLQEIKNTFSQFMIKDYVKSVKGTDFPKCISSDIDEDEFNRLMKKFLGYRGELYTGGICIKEYLDLKLYGDKTNEYRVFYMNHQIATVSRNSGQPCYTAKPPKKFIEKYRNLPSPFYTVDYAELSDCTWKIIEAGDGQVSGLSDNQDIHNFYRLISVIFER